MPKTMNKSNPARTLVITGNRTTKRLFHKALSNVLFQKLMLAVALRLGFSDLRLERSRRIRLAPDRSPGARQRVNPLLSLCGTVDQKTVQNYGNQGTCDDQALAVGGKQAERDTELAEHEGELSNLGQTGCDYDSGAERVPAHENDQKCRRRFG